MQLKLFHTLERRAGILKFPALASGSEQWLGDGFYFWQDIEFAEWWGKKMKCKKRYPSSYDIYNVSIDFDHDDFIDTVFNETDYREFIKNVELFAQKYHSKFRRKPSLEEFNDFISDNNIWDEIGVIRFQDVPENNKLVKVNDFYYKKRIQIRVNKPELITNFALLRNVICVH